MGQGRWIRGLTRLFLLMALLVFALPSPLIVAQGTAVFSRIDVAGNQRIEADSIRAFAGIEPGQPVTPEQLNLAVRNLFDTGLFEDVTVMPEAGRLVITVKENPTINQIAFEGNDSLDDEELNAGDPAPARGWPTRCRRWRRTPSASSRPTGRPGATRRR